MILLRCHIENFGVLSNFDYSFQPGLTVILRENGFGKSTFAAFVKAMLYGLQKDGNSIEKNERKRFEPWQGGKFGGYLEFSQNGTDYRVTRFFGKTAAKDTFALWDLSNHGPSTAFSDKLGEELFGLDAKSFARSTYLSQIGDGDPAATTSIQAKLSGLVEDTNDLNNFDTAQKKLKDARKKLGVTSKLGSLIPDTQAQYHDLELQAAQARASKPRLEELDAKIMALNVQNEQDNRELESIRIQITQAADRQTRVILQGRKQELEDRVKAAQAELEALERKYPRGFPALSEIEAQKQCAARLGETKKHLQALEKPEDWSLTQREQPFFPDQAQTARDLEEAQKLCTALSEAAAGGNVQWLPQEKAELEQLERRFLNGAPEKAELEELKKDVDILRTLQVRLEGASMEAGDRLRLSELEERFSKGLPSEEALTSCEENLDALRTLRQQAEGAKLEPSEEQTYQELRRTFGTGVPSEEEIQQSRQSCRRIAELDGMKSRQTAIVEAEPKKKNPALLVLGLLLAAVGTVLLVKSLTIPGAALLAAGAGLGVLGFRQENRQTRVVNTSAITEAENQELYDRQRELRDFLLRFYENAQEPEEKLSQLQLDRERYLNLREKSGRLAEKQRQIQGEMQEKNQAVQGLFQTYFSGNAFDPGFVRSLREEGKALGRLRQKKEELDAQRQELAEQQQALRRRILETLNRYPGGPSDLRQGAEQLERDAAQWAQLQEKKKALEETRARSAARKQELEARLRAILMPYDAWKQETPAQELVAQLRRRFDGFRLASQRLGQYEMAAEADKRQMEEDTHSLKVFRESWGLTDVPEALSTLEEDVRRRAAVLQSLQNAREERDAFLKANPGVSDAPMSEAPVNVEALKQSENALLEARRQRDEGLRTLRLQRDGLRRTVEELPQLEDRMAQLEEDGKRAVEKYTLLTDTMTALEQARDRLANSYVGKVQRQFTHYADTLLEGQLDGVLLDKDLTLRVDAQGEPREVVSFSAGTADCLMLCMRLALVDALFENEKPVIILDDPFVNLDDRHTQKALELLRKIAENRQVVYLVCNSGRSL